MNRIYLQGDYWLIPDGWDAVMIRGHLLRRHHAAGFRYTTRRGRKITVLAEFVEVQYDK